MGRRQDEKARETVIQAATDLPRAFYARPTLEVALDLIGKVLVHVTPAGTAAGMVVEVEAYAGEDDPACHAAAGLTARNAPLYGSPGLAYVYLNYGLHHLLNAVTEPPGSPGAVLIRALEPREGLALMRRRRTGRNSRRGGGRGTGAGPADVAVPRDEALCRGPGNLTTALGVTLGQNGSPLAGATLYVEDRGERTATPAWSSRIGIRVGVERRWRCYVPDCPSVSGRH